MWNRFVSISDALADDLVSGFVVTGLRHPVLLAAFLLALLALAIRLWFELLKALRASPEDEHGGAEMRPMRLRR